MRFHPSAVSFAVMLTATSPAAEPSSLIPLLEALKQDALRSYVYSRCAAVYLAGLDFATRIEGPQTGEADDLFTEAIGFHLAMAHIESGNDPSSLPTVDPNVTELVNSLQDRYKVLMNENYLSQGNIATGLVAEDLEVCRAIKEALLE